jgi:hypothetical protein
MDVVTRATSWASSAEIASAGIFSPRSSRITRAGRWICWQCVIRDGQRRRLRVRTIEACVSGLSNCLYFTSHVLMVRIGLPSLAGPAGRPVAPLPGSRHGDVTISVRPAGFPHTHTPFPGYGPGSCRTLPPSPLWDPLLTASCRPARVGLGSDDIPLWSSGAKTVARFPTSTTSPTHTLGGRGPVLVPPAIPFGPLGTRGAWPGACLHPPTRAALAAGRRGPVLVPPGPHVIPGSIGHIPHFPKPIRNMPSRQYVQL